MADTAFRGVHPCFCDFAFIIKSFNAQSFRKYNTLSDLRAIKSPACLTGHNMYDFPFHYDNKPPNQQDSNNNDLLISRFWKAVEVKK